MTAPRKPREIIGDLLGGSEAGEVMTPADVDAQLADAGVDVPAFLSRVRARIKEVEDTERLAWRGIAQKKLATHRPVRTGQYAHFDRQTLMAEVARRQKQNHEARAFFHKLEELTVEDLRTWLEDDDSLDEPEDNGDSK